MTTDQQHDPKRVLRDGERIRVPIQFMDGETSATEVADAQARADAAYRAASDRSARAWMDAGNAKAADGPQGRDALVQHLRDAWKAG